MEKFANFLQRFRWFVRKRLSKEFRLQLNRPLQRFGSDYGGWFVDPTNLNSQSIIYSFGIGDDISFDLSLIASLGCKVFAFDPTPKSINWIKNQNTPEQFHFFDFGLAGQDGHALFNPPENSEHMSYSMIPNRGLQNRAIEAPVYRVSTIMKMLGHHKVDILKMDIEGAEYEVISDINFSNIDINQFLVEFHHRFQSIGWKPTKSAIEKIHKSGYCTIFVSSSGEEFTFLKELG